jgi:serine/threonine protein phosphatase PrpC
VQPRDIIRIGSITFAVERFNTGAIADVGTRSAMEDTYVIEQDLHIDDYMKFTLFAVIDGHGGDWCAHYIRKRLAGELRKQLEDPLLGVRATKCMN